MLYVLVVICLTIPSRASITNLQCDRQSNVFGRQVWLDWLDLALPI